VTLVGCCLPLLALAAGGPERSSPAADDADSAANIEADVRFLADDLLEGRQTGTRGYDLAALYIATRFRQLGLEPAGEGGGYLQRVPMLRGTRERDGARVALTRDGRTTEFAFERDCLPGVNYTQGAAEVTAPLVFVGQGVRAPELGHDELAGVDVKGRIAVLLDNAPARFPADQRAFHASSTEKLRELERLGAVGVIYLDDPANAAKHPWAVGAANWQRPGMRRIDSGGRPVDDFPGITVRASCSVAVADALFAGSGHTAAEVYAMLETGKLESFDLAGAATLATRARLEPVVSHNVVGRLPGAEARLAGEHVVFTAHLDHLGIGAPKDGDAIYNGAQDNAVGVATMLEAARLLAAEPVRPARSMLFVALTAEEQGLLGAMHFAAHPTVPAASMVANVNLDMPVLLADSTDVIPTGIEHSSLDEVTRRAVAEAGLTLTVDPFPEEVIFIRSDQYAFVREGIPAIYLNGGVELRDGTDGLTRFGAWLVERYHRPNDDLQQPISWTAAAKLARLNHRIGMMIGNDPARPTWKPGDFFGERFGR
jgi:Zn-dependent M28 family amino/carboxypeptidase